MKEKIVDKNSSIQERLLQLIEMRGLNKSKLARIAGVTPQAVTKWFDRGEVGKASAMKIALATGVSVDWILEGGPELHELNGHRGKRLVEWFDNHGGLPQGEAQFFQRLIDGTAAFTDKTARRIEKEYGLPINHLDLGYDPSSPQKMTDQDKQLLYYFHKLTNEAKDEILDLVKDKADFFDRMFEELKKIRE